VLSFSIRHRCVCICFLPPFPPFPPFSQGATEAEVSQLVGALVGPDIDDEALGGSQALSLSQSQTPDQIGDAHSAVSEQPLLNGVRMLALLHKVCH
jgi:hypothetical protein